jgi:hypothetical protein
VHAKWVPERITPAPRTHAHSHPHAHSWRHHHGASKSHSKTHTHSAHAHASKAIESKAHVHPGLPHHVHVVAKGSYILVGPVLIGVFCIVVIIIPSVVVGTFFEFTPIPVAVVSRFLLAVELGGLL